MTILGQPVRARRRGRRFHKDGVRCSHKIQNRRSGSQASRAGKPVAAGSQVVERKTYSFHHLTPEAKPSPVRPANAHADETPIVPPPDQHSRPSDIHLQSPALAQSRRHQMTPPHNLRILSPSFFESANMLLRHNQNMRRRLGINIVNANACSSSKIFFEGISPEMILQNKQSSISHPLSGQWPVVSSAANATAHCPLPHCPLPTAHCPLP